MTLLTVVQNVMDANGWPSPTTGVVGVTDQNMRQAYALCNKAVYAIATKKNWPAISKDYSFETVVGQSKYPCPSDFRGIIAGTAWNADQYYQLQGSMTPALWYRRMYNGTNSIPKSAYRISIDPNMPGFFNVYPTPESVETLAFMYKSNLWVMSSSGVLKWVYGADDDTCILGEYLVELGLTWRWREKKGMDFSAELAEYNAAIKDRFSSDLAAGDIDIGGRGYDRYIYDWPMTNGYIGPGPIGNH
jgi:hypothetical protein